MTSEIMFDIEFITQMLHCLISHYQTKLLVGQFAQGRIFIESINHSGGTSLGTGKVKSIDGFSQGALVLCATPFGLIFFIFMHFLDRFSRIIG